MLRSDRGSNVVVVTNLDAEGTNVGASSRSGATALSYWQVIHAAQG
jgi:hypothetical protein